MEDITEGIGWPGKLDGASGGTDCQPWAASEQRIRAGGVTGREHLGRESATVDTEFLKAGVK